MYHNSAVMMETEATCFTGDCENDVCCMDKGSVGGYESTFGSDEEGGGAYSDMDALSTMSTSPTSDIQMWRHRSDSICVCCDGDEGTFELLPDEMRETIFEQLVASRDWKSVALAASVNWRWKQEIEYKWRQYCVQERMLQDEAEWKAQGKDWRWVCRCLSNVLTRDAHKSDIAGALPRANYEAQYEGEWKDNKKHGVGRIWWANGDRFIGQWAADAKEGNGTMLWENGDRYDGGWRADLRDGQAVYRYANGAAYHGGYSNDERHGPGALVWPDGDRFEGTWRSGGRFGHGRLITRDGQVIEQEWNENPYVSYSVALPPKIPSPPTH